MAPPVRHIWDSLRDEMNIAIPPELLDHRTMVYERHLELPIRL